MVASSDQVSYVTYYTWMAECVSQPARYVDHDRCINPEPAPQTRHQRQTFQSINQSKRKTSNANGQTNLGHKHKAPDHNHEATQPMVDLPHTS